MYTTTQDAPALGFIKAGDMVHQCSAESMLYQMRSMLKTFPDCVHVAVSTDPYFTVPLRSRFPEVIAFTVSPAMSEQDIRLVRLAHSIGTYGQGRDKTSELLLREKLDAYTSLH